MPEPRKAKKRQYYLFSNDYTKGHSPGREFSNLAALQEGGGIMAREPWPDGYMQLARPPWRIPQYLEVPRLVFDKKLGRPLRDVESAEQLLLISDAAKTVFDSVDKDAFAYQVCETVSRTGEPAPRRWICTVARVFAGAVDAERSQHLTPQRGPGGRIWYSVHNLTRIQFHTGAVDGAHAFHLAELGTRPFCDDILRDACRASKLTGLLFRQVTD
jgi:hypothetical protein